MNKLRSGRKTALVVAGATLALGFGPAGTATVPVGAAVRASVAVSPENCRTWWDPGDNRPHRVVRNVDSNGRSIQLRVGAINGFQHGWARITGATRRGDSVWLDASGNGGATWLQCGPFLVGIDGYDAWSKAARARPDPNLRFRACGSIDGVIRCTGWW